MVRNLAAQIEAIWPQEQPIFARHPPPSRILDVGCGIGESIFKLAQLYPKAAFTGVDLEESHLERACAKCCVRRLETFHSRVVGMAPRVRCHAVQVRASTS